MKKNSCLLLVVLASLVIGLTEQAELQPYLVVIWTTNETVTTATTPTTSATTPTTIETTQTTQTTIPTTITTTTTTTRRPITTRTTTSTTEAPIPTTDTTNAPTDTTNAPTDTTNAPTDTTNAPTDTTNAPTDTTNAPTDTTNPPTDTTNAPTDTTNAPTYTTNAPTTTTTTSTEPPTEAMVAARLVHTSDTQRYRTLYNTQKLLAVVAGVEHTAVCTGALVSKRHVLTSATCAESLSPGDVITTSDLVNLGEVEDEDFYIIDRVIPYGNTAINNVALLRLRDDKDVGVSEVGWRTTRAPVTSNCYSSFWDIRGTAEQTVENRTVTPCYVEQQKPEHICSAASRLLEPSLEEREGAVLVCDDLVAGIFSIQLNDPEVTGLMKYQEISTYSQWITKITSAASYVNMSFTAFFAMAAIVAATAF